MYTISYPSGTIRLDGAEVLTGPAMDEYVDWLRQGNGPQVIEETDMRRIIVSAWQIRKALNQSGMRGQVETAVDASGNQDIIDGWRHATEFQSDNALVLGMRTALGMTESEMYAIFQLAEAL